MFRAADIEKGILEGCQVYYISYVECRFRSVDMLSAAKYISFNSRGGPSILLVVNCPVRLVDYCLTSNQHYCTHGREESIYWIRREMFLCNGPPTTTSGILLTVHQEMLHLFTRKTSGVVNLRDIHLRPVLTRRGYVLKNGGNGKIYYTSNNYYILMCIFYLRHVTTMMYWLSKLPEATPPPNALINPIFSE